ncbi:hypothetical protein FOXB_02526 [Fusarium oxysporum f. sp. conglutinans Fo5176]|uniref:Uncharacterized protein n=1 Tax=Fusarium oxysporum (strain Fo5176) TaxID=660025 RepID=F9F801_FUSOF|nr:hypothetical protein FOXB_02526 [Fusarium oxysporum f. sp. conglutinans Fo5176]
MFARQLNGLMSMRLRRPNFTMCSELAPFRMTCAVNIRSVAILFNPREMADICSRVLAAGRALRPMATLHYPDNATPYEATWMD